MGISPFIACCWSDHNGQTTTQDVIQLLTDFSLFWRNMSSDSHWGSKINSMHMVWSLRLPGFMCPKSSNLTISFMDRPALSPNLRWLCGRSFLLIFSLLGPGRRWGLLVAETNSPGLHEERRSNRKKGALLFLLWSLRCEQTRWSKRLASLHSGRQSRLSAIDVKCHLKLVVLPHISISFSAPVLLFPFLC